MLGSDIKRTRDRDDLLLTAGERTGVTFCQAGKCGETLVHFGDAPARAFADARDVRAHHQVFFDGHVAEEIAAFRYHGETAFDDFARAMAVDARAVEGYRCRRLGG